MSRPGKNNVTTARVVETLRAAGQAGLLAQEIAGAVGISTRSLWVVLWYAVDDGLVAWWPDPLPKCANRRRYWLTEMRPEQCPPPTGPRLSAAAQARPAPAAVSKRRLRRGELPGVRVPAGFEVTVCPSCPIDTRYQVDPKTRVVGGFAAAGIGRYMRWEV